MRTICRKPGKTCGSSLYVHRLYEEQVVPTSALLHAKRVLIQYLNDTSYTGVKYDRRTGNVTFQWCDDFDTADEPTVGRCFVLTGQGRVKIIEKKEDPQIWHHKWMWVADDYKGFNVEASKKHSELWTKHVSPEERRRIGTKSFWEKLKHRWEN